MAQATINPNKKITEVHVVAGEVALDGSNPTEVVIASMDTITGVSLALAGSSAPGVGTSVLTYSTSGGTLSVYAWKVTAAGNATLIASSGTENFGYTIVGN